ncbi:MAG: hypothetical protein JW991_00380 [Candidatus Pacebacteria bacterium]|nr:hypothetical protein [Candidatus Paceibacterota bacterium]
MATVFVKDKIGQNDLRTACQDYGDFIKITLDLKTDQMVIGGQWHADGEKILLDSGCRQENIWGGSIDLASGQIDTIALINIRPSQNNNSQEILDQKIKTQFIKIVKERFGL